MDIEKNKERYTSLLTKINRNDPQALIEYLNSTDFFTAPASTKYHMCCKGGLCQHSLNVYDSLVELNNTFNLGLDEESMILVALLHDVSKVNFYEEYIQNRKYYNDGGSKWDEGGHYDWVSVKSYKIKEPELREVARDHEFDSYFKVKDYINLRDDEIVAIVNHHGGMGDVVQVRDLNQIYDRNPLAAALHMADLAAVYFKETQFE